ncbi:prenylcysteine oxidase 1 isoform X2 [Hydra vulgaris]|uniref:Prenylcysteine oxidase 1 n=2 Tax=Hydra vulgaris TaxID=6087 RepID=T2M427_HYDVU|nr:prenylcysteine oxidase 1 isoform X2 [Hydra vulgaris]
MLKLISVTATATALSCFGCHSLYHSLNTKVECEIKEKNLTSNKKLDLNETCHKVAIIGSGIGGCSAAYFLRKLMPNVKIDVYEKSHIVGGRLSIVKVGDHEFEAGGSIIHNKNQYVVNFMKETGLQPNVKPEKNFGIYNNEHFVFVESGVKIYNFLKLLWRYGPYTLYKMNLVVNETLKQFDNIYSLQDYQKAYRTVEELLVDIGGEKILQYTKETLANVMLKEGVSKKLIDELITAAIRVNYGQNTNINAFAGLVALAGIQGDSLFSIKGGNYQICKNLLSISYVNLMLDQEISSIQKCYDNSTKKVYYNLEFNNDERSKVNYDCVIIAAPLEAPKCILKCNNCLNWPSTQGSFKQIFATFVQGCLKYDTFNCKSENEVPSFILTTENLKLKYTSIGVQTDVYGIMPEKKIYKLFSHYKLNDDDLKSCFHLDNSLTPKPVVEWYAYPAYNVPEVFAPFKLDDGVFYVNAIERAASAMEMSAIGGRNAAILSYQYLEK